MHALILFCGFFGAWLLVAGPVFQAALELDEEEATANRLRARMAELPAPAMPSRWWWLVPPVRLLLGRKRREIQQQQLVEHLSDEEYDALTDYVNKALGWILVGAGGLLLAVKETYELVEGLDWSLVVFWVLVVVMVLVAFGHAAARSGRDRAVRSARHTSPRAASPTQPS